MKKRSICFIVAIIFTCYVSAQAGTNKEDATWEVYTNTSDVRSLSLSDDGATLWVGTWAGLEERDSVTGRCKRLYIKSDGLPENSISSVLSDGSEGVWVGTDGGGLAYLKSGLWKIFNTANSDLPLNNINCLLNDGSGGLWIGTDAGLARLKSDNKTWEIFDENDSHNQDSKLPDNYVGCLLNDGSGGIWIGTENGLAHRKADGEWEIFDRRDSGQNGSKLPDNYVLSLLDDQDGGLWIGTQFGGLAHLKSDKTWEIFDKNDSDNRGSKLPDNQVKTLLSDAKGGLWIGTWEYGLVHFSSDGKWTIFDESNSIFPDNNVRCLSGEPQKGIWAGTYGGGLAYLKAGSNTWEVFDSGLPGNSISNLLIDGDRGIWVGTDRGLGHLKSNGAWEVFNTAKSNLPETVETLANDTENGLWIGTRTGRGKTGGLFCIRSNGQIESFRKENSRLPDNEILSLLTDSNSRGGVWVGTLNGGLAHFDSNGSWEIFDKSDSEKRGSNLPDNSVTCLLSDSGGQNNSSSGIWIGTKAGLARLKSDKSWEIFDKVDSEKRGSKLPDNYITCLLNDNSGGIWIGTKGGAAHLKSDKSWEIFDKSDSEKRGSKLPDDNVVSLAGDGSQGIWIGTWQGGLAHLKSDKSWEIFNAGSSQLTNNYVKSLSSYSNYELWVGTDRGLARLTFDKKAEIIDNNNIDQNTKTDIKNGKRASIIIAAGSASPRENKFWSSTEYLTSLIYSAFYERGYDHSEIYYISPKSWATFNSDGRNDFIVDAPVTSEDNGRHVNERNINSEDILKAFEWAKSKGRLTQPLFLYFVDHGGQGVLRLNSTEEITGQSLSSMIDDYQNATGSTVVVIIDACFSGSMLPYLSNDNRIIITSSSAMEPSYYDQNGEISFTSAFLMNIDGTNLNDALSYAKDTMVNDFPIHSANAPTPLPLLDDNGDGVSDDFDGSFARKFGINGTWGKQDPNIAVEVVGENRTVLTGGELPFELKVYAAGAVKKVWGVVRPPYPYIFYDAFGTVMMQNPTFTFSFSSKDPKGYNIYTGSFSGFSCAGDYSITFFARDNEQHFDVSSSIKVSASGGSVCLPNNTTRILCSKKVYYKEDTINIQVQNIGNGFYDQYTAIFWPDGSYNFLTKMNVFSDKFFPVWGSITLDMNNLPVTVLNLPVSETPLLSEMPTGKYSVYNLLVPSGSDVIEVLNKLPPENWILGFVDFEVDTK